MNNHPQSVLFTRSGDQIEIHLNREERSLTKQLAQHLRALLEQDSHPHLRRLYPTAYPDNTKRDAEYINLVHNDLRETRLKAVNTVETTSENNILQPDELDHWITVISSLRLIIGTQLDVSETEQVDPERPNSMEYSIFLWLGLFLENAVEVSSSFLINN